MSILGFVSGGDVAHSLAFTVTDSLLSISSDNFGTYDRTKFAISLWYKPADISHTQRLYMHGTTGFGTAFRLSLLSSGQLEFIGYDAGGQPEGNLTTVAADLLTVGAWAYILLYYDSANTTSTERMRMFVNGDEIVDFASPIYPAGPIGLLTGDIPVSVGGETTNPGLGLRSGSHVWQAGFFSGVLPDIGDLYLPRPLGGITGLQSVLDVAQNTPTHDGVLASTWTNTLAVTTSTDIPT